MDKIENKTKRRIHERWEEDGEEFINFYFPEPSSEEEKKVNEKPEQEEHTKNRHG